MSSGTESGIGCIAMGSIANETETKGSAICETLGKKDLAVVGAVAVQANSTCLVSGATVIQNFLKKSMPRMGPSTVACKKLTVNSLPRNWTVFEIKPQEGIGWPSAPLRRGPDGLTLDVQGTILNVAPVSIKYLSLVNSSMRKMRLAFAGKCMTVAVVCAEFAAELVRVLQRFIFPTRNTGKYTCELCCRRSCKTCTCNCPEFEKKKSQSRK
jgi:hypothetical protein